ncbi:MAG: hypothetical protein JO163_22640 [Methylobacteriaceae bacterium]|nr:hypothetical protein [Methylobacteriaceae bacterium]MBV9705534.1 hypothetical protein [Methylobacteriaceae bacterium]
MDPSELVSGGAAGLRRIGELLVQDGFPLTALYLWREQQEDGERWAIVIVSSADFRMSSKAFFNRLVRLKNRPDFPSVAVGARFYLRSVEDPVARQVIDYARRIGTPVARIESAMWNGIYIDYAVVVRWPDSDRAAA